MFFILSKLLDFLVMPIIWVLAIFIYAVSTRLPKRRLRAIQLGLGLLLILSNPFIINTLLLWWEVSPVRMQNLKKDYELGIVLTGITLHDKSPKDRIYFSLGAERVTHALWLYRQGKIKKILITGATVNIFGGKKISEAHRLKEFLEQCKVPAKDIILEEQARNTRENALYSQQIIAQKFPQASCLLITSGFHMRRALACFHRVGLSPRAFSAGFLTRDFSTVGIQSFIPSEKAIYLWYILIHELVGYVVYKALSYA